MDKFSKLKKEKPEKKSNMMLFDADCMKVMKKDGWNYIDEPDSICVIPIIIEDNQILLRMEVIPSFQSRDNQEYHLTSIAGTVEEGEDLKDCLIRELEEEAGLKLKDSVAVEFFESLYKSKSQSSKFHLSVLPLNIYNFDQVIAQGDGSKQENESKTVSVDIKNINSLFPADTVTYILIEEAKKYLNIK